jgi:Pentapeptide repeats (8 copies)
MANPEHVALLQQGRAAWNAWRKEHWLVRPDLSGADFNGAYLFAANLSGAELFAADLSGAALSATDFNSANFGNTILGNVDLSQAQGLETVRHRFPSTIGIDTLVRSKGVIPEIFLRGAGVSEPFITSLKSLISAIVSAEIKYPQFRQFCG